MVYFISGTAVASVDYTDLPFGGTSATGNALSTMGAAGGGWISYTFDRPTVRTAPDGKNYFIVKNLSFRVCSSPDSTGKSGVAYKMYGRASYADGSAYTNSYQPPNSYSWQVAPTVTYTFQGTQFPIEDNINGTTMRVWLVSGGSFLFQRNSTGTGHVVSSTGATYAGSPAGYMTVAQIASAPQNLKVVRTAANVQNVTITWEPSDHAGGTTSGYHLEVAEDAAFTIGVREYYPAIKSGGALLYTSTGYSQNKVYYFRIATRNEVSEYFDLKGGQWSNVVVVPTSTAGTTAPPTDAGIPAGSGGTNGSGGSTTTSPGGSDGSQGSSVPTGTVVTGTSSTVGGQPTTGDTSSDSGASGTSGSAGSSGDSTSGAATSDLQKVITRIAEVEVDLQALNGLLQDALSTPTSANFKAARASLNALRSDITYITTRSVGAAWLAGWNTAAGDYQAAYTALSDAATSAAGGATGSGGEFTAAVTTVAAIIADTTAAITGTPTAAGGGTGTPVIVYTPIPDTSAERAAKGGRLISKQPTNTATTVFVYDRGGRRRLGQLRELTQIAWGRVRDDTSSATIQMTPEAAERNKAVLDRMGVARSELVIFRGDQRVWEGPIVRSTFKRSGVELVAQDVSWYLNKAVMRAGYTNAYPNVGFVVDRIAGIITAEMSRLETPVMDASGRVAVPPINVLPYLHTYVEAGDSRTSAVSDPYTSTVWGHLDDLAATGGIDYTVVGRALHIWDTSRAAMGRTRTVTEQDFIGDPYISEYGSQVATVYSVTDGQGDYATFFNDVETKAPYYGQLEQVATAYGASSTTTTTDPATGAVTTSTTATTVSVTDMGDQAQRGARGRDPAPSALHVPDNSSIDTSRSGLGIDILIPGVYVPVLATFSGRTFAQVQKIKSVDVVVSASREGVSETVNLVMEPAADDDSGVLNTDEGD